MAKSFIDRQGEPCPVRLPWSTVEIGHESTRSGLIVQFDGIVTIGQLRMMITLAFEIAASAKNPDVTNPGWWAAVLGSVAVQSVGGSIQRVRAHGSAHAVMRVERGRMLCEHPLWPMVRMHAGARWLDLRGEAALLLGPADEELIGYARGAGIDDRVGLAELRRMFDVGVLEWSSELPSGRRREVVASAGMA